MNILGDCYEKRKACRFAAAAKVCANLPADALASAVVTILALRFKLDFYVLGPVTKKIPAQNPQKLLTSAYPLVLVCSLAVLALKQGRQIPLTQHFMNGHMFFSFSLSRLCHCFGAVPTMLLKVRIKLQ